MRTKTYGVSLHTRCGKGFFKVEAPNMGVAKKMAKHVYTRMGIDPSALAFTSVAVAPFEKFNTADVEIIEVN